jgi:hypothetical protein
MKIIKSIFPYILIFTVIFIWYAVLDSTDKTTAQEPPNTKVIYEYYYGLGCSDCVPTNNLISSLTPPDNIIIKSYETFNHYDNQTRLTRRAELCNIDPNNINLPLLYTPTQQCITGSNKIINFLNLLVS